MKSIRTSILLLLTLVLAAIVTVSAQESPQASAVASSDLSPGVPAIIKMHQSGVPSDMIIKAVQSSGGPRTLTPNDLIALKGANVPDEVIRAIAGQPQQNAAPAPNPAAISPSAAAPTKPSPPMDLRSVRRIYVENMPADLDQYIRAEITKKFKGRVLVVLKPEDADAVMVGTGDHKTGVGAAVTGRWLGLHDTASGAVSLVDKGGTVVLWSSEAGDRSLWWGALKRGGPRKVADRLVHNLKDAMGM